MPHEALCLWQTHGDLRPSSSLCALLSGAGQLAAEGEGMRVLVACEFSGRVRAALRAVGVDAWSNDLRPSRTYPGLAAAMAEQWGRLMLNERAA